MKKNWPVGNWIAFFSADWCGHCKDFKNEWKTFSTEISENNQNVGVINIDSKELENKDIKPEVFGFPTIRAYRDGKMIKEFDNHRTAENLHKFVNLHFKKSDNKQDKNDEQTSNTKKEIETFQSGGGLYSNAPYDVNVSSEVPLTQQWDSPQTQAPPPKYNGGLYTGPPFAGPWGNIPVTPTASNMTHKNLRSAEPPPGAINQYPGSHRLGNNYNAMPNVNWFQSPGQAKTRLLCTPSKQSQTGGNNRKYKKNKKSYRKLNKRMGSRMKNRSTKNRSTKNKSFKKQFGGSAPYAASVKTDIPLTQQWESPQTKAPPPAYNGGLYTGPPFAGPWGNIPVTPTASNMTHNNLRSAEPPPGATQQYPGSNRQGNNFNAMPGVNWFQKNNQGPYRIQCTTGKQSGGSKKRRNSRNKKKSKK